MEGNEAIPAVGIERRVARGLPRKIRSGSGGGWSLKVLKELAETGSTKRVREQAAKSLARAEKEREQIKTLAARKKRG